jgi:hypothetical protein
MSPETNTFDLFEEDELDNLFNFAFPPPNAQTAFHGQPQQESLVISFLEACLRNRGWAWQDLADHIGTDVQWIDDVFSGALPVTDIEPDVLANLAHAIGYEPVILELMLDYSKTPQTDLNALVEKLVRFAVDGGEVDAVGTHADALDSIQTQLAQLLVRGFDGYRNAEIKDDHKQQILYEGVIKAIKSAIENYQVDIEEAHNLIAQIKSNYRAEVKSIQSMIEELRTMQAVHSMFNVEDISPERLIEHLENMQ